MTVTELAKELIEIVQRSLADKSSTRVIQKRVIAQLDECIGVADSESVIVIKLNCGEPKALTCNNSSMNGATVIFLEDSTMADDTDDIVFVEDENSIVAEVMSAEYNSDLSEYVSASEEFETGR